MSLNVYFDLAENYATLCILSENITVFVVSRLEAGNSIIFLAQITRSMVV